MTNNTYKINMKNESDEDENFESLYSPCFQISSDVQLKDVPTTGEEYLLKVMKERQNYSVVTKCTKDLSKFAKNQSRFVKELPYANAPDSFKPTIEWQNIQVADFSDVRMYLSRLISKNPTRLSDTDRTVVSNNTLACWKTFFREKEPTLSCVLGLPLTMLERGLQSLIEILGEVKPGETIDYKTGQWIYAFLACTSQPLLSETTSILRNLARKCAEIRSHINPESENAREAVAPLNIFICLVGRYFRQYDLAD